MRQPRINRQLDLFDKLVIDCFAGGGGASTGIEAAIGRSVDIAINHDPEAITMHMANHPLTKHYCESIWDVDPLEATGGKPVGFMWFSPDCKHFSKAKGGKPRDQKIRMLAEVTIPWIAKVRPDVFMLENVEEFLTYGPLLEDGSPDPDKKGEYFTRLVQNWRSYGYTVEWRILKACDYGAPTTRKRLIIIARRDGKPIVWPAPTHGNPNSQDVKSGKLKPWRTAAECIDWSLPIQSIFDRKKPLAEATMRRIARGIQKYAIDAKQPFIVTTNHGGDGFRGNGTDEQFKTLTASRDDHRLVVPKLMHYRDMPGGKPRIQDLEDPMSTIPAGGKTHALLVPTLIQTSYGERKGQAPRVPGLEKPLGTTMAQGVKHGLVAASLVKHYDGNYQGAGLSPDEPLHTITTQDHHSVVCASMVRMFGTTTGAPLDEPMKTIMSGGGGGKNALCAVHLSRHFGESVGSDLNEPAPTIMSGGGGKSSAVYAFLSRFNGNPDKGEGTELDEPAGTVTSKDRFALVTIGTEQYAIVDIGMRMLEPHELYLAQGFPPGYIIAPEHNGKRLTKTAQVRMVGNSVCPPLSEALVRANYQETKPEKKRKAA